jgi:hypothetical protein
MEAIRSVKIDPQAKLIFHEMIGYTGDKSRFCWPSVGRMSIRLALSEPTIRKNLRRLVTLGFIRKAGKVRNGVTKYEILDGWANAAIDAMTIRLDKQREAAAARQAKSRASRRANVTQASLRPEPEMSRNDGFDLSRNDGFDKHLKRTPSEDSSEEGINPYAAAKGRV